MIYLVVLAIIVISGLEVGAFWLMLSSEVTDNRLLMFSAVMAALTPTVGTLLVLLTSLAKFRHEMFNGAMKEQVKEAISEDRHKKGNDIMADFARRYRAASPAIRERMRAAGYRVPPEVDPEGASLHTSPPVDRSPPT